jgi:hypothetical protein
MSIKILFKSLIAKILNVLFLKIMLIMDLQNVLNLCSYLLFQILKWDMIEKDVIYKKSYNVFHWPQKRVPSPFSLSHALSFSQWSNEKSSFE